MSIATAITNLQGKIANAYTAIENKGGTLPATQNAENLSATIDAIPGGSAKWGITTDNMFPTQDGTLFNSNLPESIVFTGVTNIGEYGLYYRFYHDATIKSVEFPDLTSVSSAYALAHAFDFCESLSSISFPALSSISGTKSFNYICANCKKLSSVTFPELTIIMGDNVAENGFNICNSLSTVYFPKLTTLSGKNIFTGTFGSTKVSLLAFPALTTIISNVARGFDAIITNNATVTRIDFPVLTTIKKTESSTENDLEYLFNSMSKLAELHFGAGNQAIIEASAGYATKWNAPSTCQIYFDL